MTDLERRIANTLGDLTQFRGHATVDCVVHLADGTSWHVTLTSLGDDTWELTDYYQRS